MTEFTAFGKANFIEDYGSHFTWILNDISKTEMVGVLSNFNIGSITYPDTIVLDIHRLRS